MDTTDAAGCKDMDARQMGRNHCGNHLCNRFAVRVVRGASLHNNDYSRGYCALLGKHMTLQLAACHNPYRTVIADSSHCYSFAVCSLLATSFRHYSLFEPMLHTQRKCRMTERA